MAFQTTSFLGSGSYSAQRDRMVMMEALRTEGVLRRDDLEVSERGAGANWSVDIATGHIFVQGDNIAFQGLYHSFNDAVINKGFTTLAPAANPRVDTIIARIYDAEAGQIGSPQDTMFIEILPGTETAGADTTNLNGKAALPATAFPLAYAVIPTTAVSVLDAYLVSARKISNPKIYGEDNKIYRLGVDAFGVLGLEEQV